MKTPTLKLVFSTVTIFILTACGQKGALYFPEKQLSKENSSEIPTQTADNSDNPTNLNNVQSPTTIDSSIKPNADY